MCASCSMATCPPTELDEEEDDEDSDPFSLRNAWGLVQCLDICATGASYADRMADDDELVERHDLSFEDEQRMEIFMQYL